MKQFEGIGAQIMRLAGAGSPFNADPLSAVLGDHDKRAAVAQLLGQAYLSAYNVVAANREKVEHIAEVLTERREMHGDEVVALLDAAELTEPEIDLLDERSWPRL